MKAFIIALIVFVVISGFVAFSSLYLTNRTDELISLAGQLPGIENTDGFESVSSDISELWSRIKGPVRYFAGHMESDQVEDALEDLISRFFSGDKAGYSAAKTKLISQLERINSAEKFTCDSLF